MNLKLLAFAGMMQLTAVGAGAEGVYTNRDSSSLFFKLGKIDQADRRYASAWKYYEKAAKHDSRDADIQLAISDVCFRMNRMAPGN